MVAVVVVMVTTMIGATIAAAAAAVTIVSGAHGAHDLVGGAGWCFVALAIVGGVIGVVVAAAAAVAAGESDAERWTIAASIDMLLYQRLQFVGIR